MKKLFALMLLALPAVSLSTLNAMDISGDEKETYEAWYDETGEDWEPRIKREKKARLEWAEAQPSFWQEMLEEEKEAEKPAWMAQLDRDPMAISQEAIAVEDSPKSVPDARQIKAKIEQKLMGSPNLLKLFKLQALESIADQNEEKGVNVPGMNTSDYYRTLKANLDLSDVDLDDYVEDNLDYIVASQYIYEHVPINNISDLGLVIPVN